MAATNEPAESIQLCFSQVKGSPEDDVVTDADIISTLEFNETGSLLATGDKGGRVVIFQRDYESGGDADFSVYSAFQSHESEFDYLKSQEIEEKINKIKWLKQCNASNFLLATNDKTIKLWKILERSQQPVDFNNVAEDPSRRITSLRVPKYQTAPLTVEAIERRTYANAHAYHINSVSLNTDVATFLSADDLRINLWNVENNKECFNIVDIKPQNMEELTEVITSCEFHPLKSHELVYSVSKGSIRMCDMRSQALCDSHAKLYEVPEDPANKSFFSEIVSSISDVKYSHDGRYIMARDYMTVKLWDVNMESKPVQTFEVHDYLQGQLCSLYENDFIFDKFECCWSCDDNHLLTGTYNNFFRVFNRQTGEHQCLEASREIARPDFPLKHRKVIAGSTNTKRKKDEFNLESMDYSKKVLHATWHPREDILAIAATNNLYIFRSKNQKIAR
ncbi:serine/threonine-protein phosphatase 2A 55 kDa regulatory subunit B alpha isoform-like [Sycon ciliatum]|uniref:serine/threonine-protein phosphatase 2A 55 kDa regulatory subunit B alpha isoform-like n=1 Tax=Sycon ciliatum TaxID=27933 RepID=UPI0020A9AEBF|eukprot:scpid44421/ scgid25635/ Serine/threonine-protein phosphatase 2A 55 kDa regulatory subunit B alpha isoform; PP2A subunit B isoform B55-alpha; PP2A subunit B isoform PR55-alpha; PP2A subunit B isoform R2-alpha; PP2A subunit B isoform alpha &gt; Serine/threonine-protein phosphatase 2A 55 kDa regulatory subunit B alpha isoform; PP2A subunit B isoform B55-alpha; PP2A subunit B isoform PR55-alpha; PP2A subunit B isoform R2-alpha; PP2A subunit B isoform alpha &gt; Serine/threonine-protein phosphatase 2